jgi:hypothetical protein
LRKIRGRRLLQQQVSEIYRCKLHFFIKKKVNLVVCSRTQSEIDSAV